MQRNQKYSRHYFTCIQYHSPILYLLIIISNYTRQAGILIVIGNKNSSLKISCLQCNSTLNHATWLNSSSKSQTLKQRTTPTNTSGSNLSDCSRASQKKKAVLKDIVNCKPALETWLNSQSGVIWGRIWDQYRQTLQQVNAETRGSHIVVLSVLQKAKKVLK